MENGNTSRMKNAMRNVFFGGALKLYQLLIPFVMRTLLIRTLGMEYAGLNGLFTSLLQLLNLAELGVGSAMVYSMYEPIAKGDSVRICALLGLYRRYYRGIGAVIAIAGLSLLPWLPVLVGADSLPEDVDLKLLYLLHLGATVLSYWLYSYKNSLLIAHQRGDLAHRVDLCVRTLQYGLQAGILYLWQDYYGYLLAALGAQIVSNLCTALVAARCYPAYRPTGEIAPKLRKEIRGRVRDLFTSKVGSVILGAADAIVISAFLGLTVLGVYQNYYYILTAVIGLVGVLFAASLAGIGNSLLVESREKNYTDFRRFSFLILWISGVGVCGLFCLLQPFMECWMGSGGLLPGRIVACLCIYYVLYEWNQLFNAYKDAAGIWHADRFRPLLTAGGNLALNLLTVKRFGLYGVVLSTVVSMLGIGMPWLIHNLFTTIFAGEDWKGYLRDLARGAGVTVLACGISGLGCSLVRGSGLAVLAGKGILCMVLANGTFWLCCRKCPEYRWLRWTVRKAIDVGQRKKIGKGKRENEEQSAGNHTGTVRLCGIFGAADPVAEAAGAAAETTDRAGTGAD